MFESREVREQRQRFRETLNSVLTLYPGGEKALYKHFPHYRHPEKMPSGASSAEAKALHAARIAICWLFEETLTPEQMRVLRDELADLDWDAASRAMRQPTQEAIYESFPAKRNGTAFFASAIMAANRLQQQGMVDDVEYQDFIEQLRCTLDGLNESERAHRMLASDLNRVFGQS